MLQNLEIIIEFSVGLSGFSGVVVLFGSEKWQEFDRFRIMNLLMSSMSAALFAFVCLLLSTFLEDETTIRISSLIFLIHLILMLIYLGYQGRKPSISEHPLMYKPLALFFQIGFALAMLALLINVTAIYGVHFGFYFGSLIWLLVVAGIQFIRIMWSKNTVDIDEG